jgi:hypothetical protein
MTEVNYNDISSCGTLVLSNAEQNPAMVAEFTQRVREAAQEEGVGLFIWPAKDVQPERKQAFLDAGWVVWGTWRGQYTTPKEYNMELYALVLKQPLVFKKEDK